MLRSAHPHCSLTLPRRAVAVLCLLPQDTVRKVGGVGVLCALLASLLRPGVIDAFQLRVAVCAAIEQLVAGAVWCRACDSVVRCGGPSLLQ